MYSIYFDNVLMPQAPSDIALSVNSRNESKELISIGEVNVLKSPGLSMIEFDMVLPNQEYSWAQYLSGFKPAQYFLKRLEEFKTGNNGGKRVFPFVVTRVSGNSKFFSTKMDVTLEEYTIKDSADEGTDIVVSVKLKQYKQYSALKIVKKPSTTTKTPSTKKATTPRKTTKKAASSTYYVVKKGDTLSGIAKKKLGNANRWREIYNLNKKLIKHPNRLSIGWKLKLPKK